jgi:hypothetical protein
MRFACAALTALALAGTADAAAARPDAHDRALAAALNAKVTTFRNIAAGTANGDDSLQKCAQFKNDPQQALGAMFVLIPVFLTEIVNDYGPEIRDLHATVVAMRPHSPLFHRWLTAEGQTFSLLLQFDNHGKKVDLCRAAAVLLDKRSTDADIYRTIGIHTVLIGRLFGSTASETVNKLNPQMRTFFVAAGLKPADAKILTSP